MSRRFDHNGALNLQRDRAGHSERKSRRRARRVARTIVNPRRSADEWIFVIWPENRAESGASRRKSRFAREMPGLRRTIHAQNLKRVRTVAPARAAGVVEAVVRRIGRNEFLPSVPFRYAIIMPGSIRVLLRCAPSDPGSALTDLCPQPILCSHQLYKITPRRSALRSSGTVCLRASGDSRPRRWRRVILFPPGRTARPPRPCRPRRPRSSRRFW